MIEWNAENLLPSVKAYLEEVNREVIRLHDTEPDPYEAIRYRSQAIDKLLISLYQLSEEIYRKENPKKKLKTILVSQGGYGRRELCLHSDIDLILVCEGDSRRFIQIFTQKALQNFWDARLEMGFALRSVKDCKNLMDKDMTVMTSLIDARVLAGDAGLKKKFEGFLKKYFASKSNRERFVQLKLAENKERKERYGGSIYLLEPNLKEGEGGLRDYHSLHWLALIKGGLAKLGDIVSHGYLSPEEWDALRVAVRFLSKVRNELHKQSGRRTDQMTFEYQKPVAAALGFQDTPQFLGVELFMQRYYSQAAMIHSLMEKAARRILRTAPKLFPPAQAVPEDANFRIVEGRLTAVDPKVFEADPLTLLKVFEIAHMRRVPIDDRTRERIEKEVPLIDDSFRDRSAAKRVFRDLLRKPEGLATILFQMNDSGVLGAFLPEFQKLHFRVQHDVYHVYTVDVHSIFAVQELGHLLEGKYARSHPTISQMVRDIERLDVLAFAVLYHDIGKGEGKGHVQKGAPLIRQRGERLGFSADDVQAMEFLELSHLIMTHIAFRRDLEEQNLIIQFAKAMGTLDLLNMLYVLTFCDVKAVSSEAMTDWKSSLLEYLYLKTREVIQKGAYTKEKASQLIPKAKAEILNLFSAPEERLKGEEFLAMMPPRYILATHPSVIRKHVRLWEQFLDNPIVFEHALLGKEGLNEVALFTWENQTLFSRVAGLFAAHNLNILDAQLNLSTKGHALQVFKVSDAEGRPITDEERWRRVERDLQDVLQGKVRIENLVAEKFKPSLFKKKVAEIRPTRVDIDNDVSAFYTVIDIYAQDRTGLLYQITSTLAALGLYVDVSKISTKVDQVADTFYVKDIFGHKITSQDRLQKIREVLLSVLHEEPTPGWKPMDFQKVVASGKAASAPR